MDFNRQHAKHIGNIVKRTCAGDRSEECHISAVQMRFKPSCIWGSDIPERKLIWLTNGCEQTSALIYVSMGLHTLLETEPHER
ncbi:unnamed protein product [Cyberlindnera jadinii]|uniref:Uncharacterized protein n=1 Tax=Cyberlindnera jadinii (strain ATCC 18201 / CBS 1600 / BCRC 20928 / JCM 3617 / NBRC 0987 / NRRL Y-1542) TaxID=983966 RepID=A0A0H5CAJ7_CYBJN|nr:unnamed protein product [Cyberlindnera jadinii]